MAWTERTRSINSFNQASLEVDIKNKHQSNMIVRVIKPVLDPTQTGKLKVVWQSQTTVEVEKLILSSNAKSSSTLMFLETNKPTTQDLCLWIKKELILTTLVHKRPQLQKVEKSMMSSDRGPVVMKKLKLTTKQEVRSNHIFHQVCLIDQSAKLLLARVDHSHLLPQTIIFQEERPKLPNRQCSRQTIQLPVNQLWLDTTEVKMQSQTFMNFHWLVLVPMWTHKILRKWLE